MGIIHKTYLRRNQGWHILGFTILCITYFYGLLYAPYTWRLAHVTSDRMPSGSSMEAPPAAMAWQMGIPFLYEKIDSGIIPILEYIKVGIP